MLSFKVLAFNLLAVTQVFKGLKVCGHDNLIEKVESLVFSCLISTHVNVCLSFCQRIREGIHFDLAHPKLALFRSLVL